MTRKNGQKIMINDDIEIIVVEAKNGVCKIAIEAPRSFKIFREEVYVQVKLANMMGQDPTKDLLDQTSALLAKKSVKINDKVKSDDSSDEIQINDSSNKTPDTRIIVKKLNKENNDKL